VTRLTAARTIGSSWRGDAAAICKKFSNLAVEATDEGASIKNRGM
jgi:hypothetical protein